MTLELLVERIQEEVRNICRKHEVCSTCPLFKEYSEERPSNNDLCDLLEYITDPYLWDKLMLNEEVEEE